MSNAKVNILPVATFGWLGVNSASQADISEFETENFILTAPSGDRRSEVIYIDREGSTDVNIKVEDNASAKAVLVYDVKGQAYSKVTAQVGEGASFELVELFLGGDVANEVVTELVGRKAVFEADIGYKLENSDRLDINLIANHHGRKTLSRINARGVLSGDAQKTFKGTIDFKKGADGAKGSENEEVLLMSDSAVNKTVPLILCAEENVEGSHGASIGRIDEKQVFYMQSRGISPDRIYELAAQAKLKQVTTKIEDADTIKRIAKRLNQGDDNE